MNRNAVQMVLSILFFLLVAGGAYLVGSYHGEKQAYAIVEKTAVDQLASQLYMLGELEKGNSVDVRRILQTGTGAQLDWIIEHGNLNQGADSLDFRCKLFKRLKTYREEHALFKTSDWDYLWQVHGMKETEKMRETFLNEKAPVICNWKSPE